MAAGSRWSRAAPCQAARRPCCRPARRRSTTSDCVAAARRQIRTRGPSEPFRSRSTPLQQLHRDLQEIREHRHAEGGDERSEHQRALPAGRAVTERRHKHAHEGRRDEAEPAEDDEHQRAGEDAGPGEPLRMLRQDILVLAGRHGERGASDEDAETDEHDAEGRGHEPRPHMHQRSDVVARAIHGGDEAEQHHQGAGVEIALAHPPRAELENMAMAATGSQGFPPA